MRSPGRREAAVAAVLAAALAALPVALAPDGPVPAANPAGPPATGPTDRTGPSDRPAAEPAAPPGTGGRPAALPGGGRRIFPGRVLVAYYGTAGTGALGVLGEGPPRLVTPRLRAAAEPFGTPARRVQIVYELIVTVADRVPGPDGDYSHDIPAAAVRGYLRAAHRQGALVVLDLQPGRSDFLTVARRWRWALRDPWVGLALDPEWRMAPGEVPARTVGQVRAREVNAVSRWLGQLAVRHDLPEKLLVVHQFRTDMVPDIERVLPRRRVALVQHVDGFGTRQQKRATYRAVARGGPFRMGFKLFYDEDSRLMTPALVRRLRPPVRFVSYQ